MEVIDTVVNATSTNPLVQVLIAVGVFSALMIPLLRHRRQSLDNAWQREFLAAQDQALTMGIHLTEDDTVFTMRAKIAEKRLTR